MQNRDALLIVLPDLAPRRQWVQKSGFAKTIQENFQNDFTVIPLEHQPSARYPAESHVHKDSELLLALRVPRKLRVNPPLPFRWTRTSTPTGGLNRFRSNLTGAFKNGGSSSAVPEPTSTLTSVPGYEDTIQRLVELAIRNKADT